MVLSFLRSFFFFFNDTATTEIYTLSLHDALPILSEGWSDLIVLYCEYMALRKDRDPRWQDSKKRSEEHTSELQSQSNLVCRLLLEKKKIKHRHVEINQCVLDSFVILY